LAGLTRRRMVQAGAALAIAAAEPAQAEPFTAATVRQAARDLAARPYQPPDTALPPAAEALTYEQYGGLRFRPERALWHGTGLPFQVSFFPRGFLYRPEVEVHEVRDGQAAHVPSGPGLFGADDPAAAVADGLGFAGLRLHAEINRPGAFDEFCVFLGASYFRAVGRGLQYGLSARGLAVGTGTPGPERFPRFRSFWIERPQPGAASLVLHALLDGEDATGAFRFAVTPGEATVMEVDSALFPRRDLAQAGMAPLTSMYYFSARGHARADDWRPAVHDSDGLAALTGRNERLWRPLDNPRTVQVSALADAGPRGFGLLQRRRGFDDFGDLQVLYNHRPGLWVEPLGDWGAGAVELVELPTGTEYADNIVAFWRGREPLRAGQEHRSAYRLHWGADPAPPTPAAQVVRTRTGAGSRPGTRAFVLDLTGDALRTLPPDVPTRLDLGSSAGRLQEGWSGPNPETGGWRISLEFDPAGAAAADLRCALLGRDAALAETWLYRWTA
jgi:glucans biosynthesis protein